ncbi:hypothetical protein [Chitinophaga varians]|uniref:hypothetical protein n=1 Tax=Chitinophaga varians TaxID=2202339 RepID=UPI00165F194B|nr:hypothetical protein [Chitinophaga varians]MBC9914599.1 hypothetical protein [Chitinophaga varians]
MMNWLRIKGDLKTPLFVAFALLFVLMQNKLIIWIFPPGRKYGVSFNAERERLGIATLPDTWTTEDKYKELKVWRAPNQPDSGCFSSVLRLKSVVSHFVIPHKRLVQC